MHSHANTRVPTTEIHLAFYSPSNPVNMFVNGVTNTLQEQAAKSGLCKVGRGLRNYKTNYHIR